MPTPDSKPSSVAMPHSARRGRCIALVVCGLLLVIALGWWWQRQRTAATASLTAAATYTEKDWAPRSLRDLVLQAPFSLRAGKDILPMLSPELRNALEYGQTFESDVKTNPQVMVGCFSYKDGSAVSLEGALDGAMAPLISSVGGISSDFRSRGLMHHGLAARRGSYEGVVQGDSVFLEGLFLQDGQKLWQVQVVALGQEAHAVGLRLLESVRVLRKPGN